VLVSGNKQREKEREREREMAQRDEEEREREACRVRRTCMPIRIWFMTRKKSAKSRKIKLWSR
jgi:hypothetical protein